MSARGSAGRLSPWTYRALFPCGQFLLRRKWAKHRRRLGCRKSAGGHVVGCSMQEPQCWRPHLRHAHGLAAQTGQACLMASGPSDQAHWVHQTRPLRKPPSSGTRVGYRAELLPPRPRLMPRPGKSPRQAATELGPSRFLLQL